MHMQAYACGRLRQSLLDAAIAQSLLDAAIAQSLLGAGSRRFFAQCCARAPVVARCCGCADLLSAVAAPPFAQSCGCAGFCSVLLSAEDVI